MVALVVVGILIAIAIPAAISALLKGQMIQVLHNARSIHLATFNMAQERISTKNQSIGWPGDIVASGTMQCKVTSFAKRLVENNYFKPRDLKIFAAAGIKPFDGSDVDQFSAAPGPENNCALTIYCVQESDTADAIFCSTINATLNPATGTFAVNPQAAPFGDKGYIVFHKGGDGAIFRKSQTTKSNLQGTPCKMALTGTAALRAE
jgi:type II secretory pathway pseudopilin PulG